MSDTTKLHRDQRAARAISKMDLTKPPTEHRGLAPGRDYRWNIFGQIKPEEFKSFRENFDDIFPDAPGAGM